MARGGKRPGAGRPKGSAVVRTSEVARKLSEDGGQTPLDYLLSVMRDEGQPLAVRMDAAKAALPFMHPRQASIQMHHEGGIGIKVEDVVRALKEARRAATPLTSFDHPLIEAHAVTVSSM